LRDFCDLRLYGGFVKKIIKAATALGVVVVAACVNPGKQYGQATQALDGVFAERGLTMLPNPSNAYGPGTMLYADGTKGRWEIACDARKARPGVEPRRSPTSTFSIDLSRRDSLGSNATLLELANLAAEYARDATFQVAVENAFMHTIDHASLKGGAVNEGCLGHLLMKRGDPRLKDRLSMVLESFEADVVVNVTLKDSAKAKAQLESEVLKRISAAIQKSGGSVSASAATGSAGKASITGKGLIWAVKDSKDAANFFLIGR
jgi:hypothetical protein